jgi:hypothetical protein
MKTTPQEPPPCTELGRAGDRAPFSLGAAVVLAGEAGIGPIGALGALGAGPSLDVPGSRGGSCGGIGDADAGDGIAGWTY